MFQSLHHRFVYWSSISQAIVRGTGSQSIYVISFPKSGSNWMCNLLAGYFQVAVLQPWNERWPVFESRIYHLHRIPPFSSIDARTVYMLRDGRDAHVSFLFEMLRSPIPAALKVRRQFEAFTGRCWKEDEAIAALPHFIEFIFRKKPASIDYSSHIKRCLKRRFHVVKYEELKTDTEAVFAKVVEKLSRQPIDLNRLRSVTASCSFSNIQTPENTHFMRRGQAGDWVNYFDRRSAELFWKYHGEAMMLAGYETDASWIGRTKECLHDDNVNPEEVCP